MGVGNLLGEFQSTVFKLLKADRIFFCRSRALVRIFRELIRQETGLLEDKEREKSLLSVFDSIKRALDLSQVRKPDAYNANEAFNKASNCIKDYVSKYWHIRLEDIKDMLNNGDSGDANVEDHISESDSRTKQILKMFQSRSLSFTLVLYRPALIREGEKNTVPSLAMPCNINQEMTLDSLLCRMPPNIAGWKFSLSLSPFCYSRNPTEIGSFTLASKISDCKIICALDVFLTMQKTRSLMSSPNLYIVMNRKFFIHIDRPPLHVFGNVWPVRNKEHEKDEDSAVAMKTLTGDIILDVNLRISAWQEIQNRTDTKPYDIARTSSMQALDRRNLKPVQDTGPISSASQSTLVAEETLQEFTPSPAAPHLSYRDHGSPSPSALAQPLLSPASFTLPLPLSHTIPAEQPPGFPSSPPLPLAPFVQEISQSPLFPTPHASRPPVLSRLNRTVEPPLPPASAVSHIFPATQTNISVKMPLQPSSFPSRPPDSNTTGVLDHNKQKSSPARSYDVGHSSSTNSDVALVAPTNKQKFSAKVPTKNDTATEIQPAGRMRALQIEPKQKPLSWFERGKKFVKDVVTGALK